MDYHGFTGNHTFGSTRGADVYIAIYAKKNIERSHQHSQQFWRRCTVGRCWSLEPAEGLLPLAALCHPTAGDTSLRHLRHRECVGEGLWEEDPAESFPKKAGYKDCQLVTMGYTMLHRVQRTS